MHRVIESQSIDSVGESLEMSCELDARDARLTENDVKGAGIG